MSVDPGARRFVSISSERSLPCRTCANNPPKTPIACDCSHHHVRRPDSCRNAVIAVHIANLESRRHREARPAQLELIYHPYFSRPAPKTGLSPKEVATAEACFPNFPTFQIWEWTSRDLVVLVHFQILECRSLERLGKFGKYIPNFPNYFRGRKRP